MQTPSVRVLFFILFPVFLAIFASILYSNDTFIDYIESTLNSFSPQPSPMAETTNIIPTILPSPHNSRNPDYTITVVGGGLAGLSAAIQAIDAVYKKLEYQFKLVATTLGVGQTDKVLEFIKQLPNESKTELIQGIPELSATLEIIHNLRVNIIDKEAKLGGNSMKASSGINAAGSTRQKDWEVYHTITHGDSLERFQYDTLKSSVSPEPPIWVNPNDHIEYEVDSDSNHPKQREDNSDDIPTLSNLRHFLSPLSVATSPMINTITKASADAIPFLETPPGGAFQTHLLDFLSAVGIPTRPIHFAPKTVNGKPYTAPRPLSLSKLTQLGGHTHQRTHRPGPAKLGEDSKFPEPPVGAGIIAELQHRLTEFPYSHHVQVICGVQALSLTTQEDQLQEQGDMIKGVIYKLLPTYSFTKNLRLSHADQHQLGTSSPHTLEEDVGKQFELRSPSVILTTGGYSASTELIQKFSPKLGKLNLPTTNGPWATGDVFAMTEALQPGLVGTAALQVHPTSFVNPQDPTAKVNFLAPEALRGVGGILLNAYGRRFVNELSTRDHVSRAIYWQPQHFAYLLLPTPAAKEFGGAINFYASRGIFVKTASSQSEFELLLQSYLGTATTDEAGRVLFEVILPLISTPTDAAASATITMFGKDIPLQTAIALNIAISMLKLSVNIPSPSGASALQSDLLGDLTTGVLRTLHQYSQTDADHVGDNDGWDRPIKQHRQAFLPASSTSSSIWDPYYISMVTPAIHYSMGGLACDEHGRVFTNTYLASSQQQLITFIQDKLRSEQAPAPESDDFPPFFSSLLEQFTSQHQTDSIGNNRFIPGLYVAGEASGGFHGRNRLGGNSLLECVAMGRIASNTIITEFYTRPKLF